MLLSSTTPKIARPRAASFSGMMELYENNYIWLRQLCGDLNLLPDRLSAVSNRQHPELTLQVVQRSPYTLTLQFFYANGYQNAEFHLPSFLVRIYFDARQAEAHGQVDSSSARIGLSLKQRWDDNLLLFKWLAYWRKCGYSFRDA